MLFYSMRKEILVCSIARNCSRGSVHRIVFWFTGHFLMQGWQLSDDRLFRRNSDELKLAPAFEGSSVCVEFSDSSWLSLALSRLRMSSWMLGSSE